VSEAFVAACPPVVVLVGGLEVDAAMGNRCDFFWYVRDRKVVSSDRSGLKVAVVFCRIDALRNEVLFLGGIEEVFILP